MMTSELTPLAPHRQQAIAELRGMIAARYPTAIFAVQADHPRVLKG
jgi:hypothetical protein